MVASYLDASSSSNIANVISYLNSTNFTLGSGIVLRSTSINDQVSVFSKSEVIPAVVDTNGGGSNTNGGGSGSGSGSGSDSAGLTAAKNSVIKH